MQNRHANDEIEEDRLLGMEAANNGSNNNRQRTAAAELRRTQTSQEAAGAILSSYFSRKFLQGAAVLFPLVVSVLTVYYLINFFDNFFSPLYHYMLGFHVFGLGTITSMLFIFATGVFTSSWAGQILVGVGDYLIGKVPLVKQIYNGAKSVSNALNPDEAGNAFSECCIIKHPRLGEHAFAFVTGHTRLSTPEEELDLVVVFVPTNHIYIGDVFLLQEKDIIRCPGLDVNTGLQVIVSAGSAVPSKLYANNSLSSK